MGESYKGARPFFTRGVDPPQDTMRRFSFRRWSKTRLGEMVKNGYGKVLFFMQLLFLRYIFFGEDIIA